ncbi:hypothetical protein H4R18_004407 [Coemansia javaensis]|uniref:Uncharacterized protein n=1 Tax=Coemansia javaensis TaxID=2761396 RepID=A0A9W8LEW2_9FUNG|nr:hypothetical protein H4R18_004407 [Coemansia javaensis]
MALFLGRYSRLVFLGDSNADNGNVLRMTRGTHPAPAGVYWQGRYCDGRAWCDHLEAMSGVPALNLAHGCATIDNDLVAGTVPMPDGRRAQVPSVVDQARQLAAGQGRLGPGELVFVQAGSNDLNSLVDAGPTYRRRRDFTPQLLAARLLGAVGWLCAHAGARTVVVLNVRPREDYPGVLALGDPQALELTRQATSVLNAAIAAEAAALQRALGGGHRVAVFDTYAFQKAISRAPAAFGIDPDLRTPRYSGEAQPLRAGPRLFLDGAHLARRAQALLAAEVIRDLALGIAGEEP